MLKRAYYNQPVWKRVAVIAAGPLVNIVLAFVLLFVVYLSVPSPAASPSTSRARHPGRQVPQAR